VKKIKNWKNEQPWTLICTFILQTMSSLLNYYFWSKPIGFPFKMMPCKLNHNIICLGPKSLFKCLGTNLKLLTNRNVRFHLTLLLGALFKVVIKIIFWFNVLGIFHSSTSVRPSNQTYRLLSKCFSLYNLNKKYSI
jgi:hypothetical protein